jgi:membrane protein implicated in regulation of membrane protease activity
MSRGLRAKKNPAFDRIDNAGIGAMQPVLGPVELSGWVYLPVRGTSWRAKSAELPFQLVEQGFGVDYVGDIEALCKPTVAAGEYRAGFATFTPAPK